MSTKDNFQRFSLLAVIGFFALLLSLTIGLTLKNNCDLRDILVESVKEQAISVSITARELIDAEQFKNYAKAEFIGDGTQPNPFTDKAGFPQYHETLSRLRGLCKETDATYIYALWKHEDKLYFIFDTDEENDTTTDPTLFAQYAEACKAHFDAYAGNNSSDLVKDDWGRYITGAVPIRDNSGVLIGVVCTDIDDSFILANTRAANINLVILVVVMAAVMAAMTVIVYVLLNRLKKVQDKMFRMANFDTVTGLPNRQYLMNHLQRVTEKAEKANVKPEFALVFIDLDNFKKVNDGAGHDAGDELLRSIARFIDNALYKVKSFRPHAGNLNVSARIGGDEFIQIASDVRNKEQAEIVAKKLIDSFHAQSKEISPFIAQFDVGLSVGVALYPTHSKDHNVLIKYADIAMYHAKKSGKHNYRIYDFSMDAKAEK